MENMFQNILFTFNSIAPVFIILYLGYFLKVKNIIDEPFLATASKLVFKAALPVFLFLKLSATDFTSIFQVSQIAFIYGGIVFSFIIVWLISNIFIKDGKDKGVFIQGAFRSNFAIVGLAIIYNIFGDPGLAKASVILAFIIPMLNTLSVIALEVTISQSRHIDLKKILFNLIKNPLIIAVSIAIPFSLLGLTLHETLAKTANYIGSLTLPLALIGIGGSLNFSQMKKASRLAVNASLYKIFWIPLVVTYIAYLLDFRGDDLGIIFIFFACPTAIVSFIMAEAMGGNSKLAGNIVVISTIGAVVTMSLGVFILKAAGLI